MHAAWILTISAASASHNKTNKKTALFVIVGQASHLHISLLRDPSAASRRGDQQRQKLHAAKNTKARASERDVAQAGRQSSSLSALALSWKPPLILITIHGELANE